MLKAIAISLLVLFALVLAWHLVFPIAGGVIALTSGIWSFIVASIVMICATIFMLFLFTGLGILLLGLFVFFWIVIGIALFPILFPILVPLLILFAFILFIRKRYLERKEKDI